MEAAFLHNGAHEGPNISDAPNPNPPDIPPLGVPKPPSAPPTPTDEPPPKPIDDSPPEIERKPPYRVREREVSRANSRWVFGIPLGDLDMGRKRGESSTLATWVCPPRQMRHVYKVVGAISLLQ